MIRQPKFLFLPHRVPFPPDKGDRIRSYHLLRYLSGLGAVDLATLADEPVRAETERMLRQLCRRVAIEPVPSQFMRLANATRSWLRGSTLTEGLFYSPRLRRTISEWCRANSYDAVVAVCSSMGQYLPQGVGPSYLDLVDIDSLKFADYAKGSLFPMRQVYASEAFRLARLERQLHDRVDRVILVSEAESRLFASSVGSDKVVGIPNGVDLEHFSRLPSRETATEIDSHHAARSAVFVGAMDYRPNIEGVVWFVEKVWKQLVSKHPQAIFSIVGRRPAPRVERLARISGVTIAPNVADVRPYLAQADVVVAPLFVARGIQNKVLEAMALSKPVIASRAALTGIELTVGEHACEANQPGEWCAALELLWNSPQRRRRLGSAARTFVEQHHNWEACLRPWRTLVLANIDSDSTAEQGASFAG